MKLFVAIYGFAASFLMVGAAAMVVGIHDASLAQAPFGVTLISSVLLVIGVVLFVGVYDLVRLGRRGAWSGGKRPPCRPIVLVAFLVLFLLGVYVFFSGIRTVGVQRLVVVIAALAFMVMAILGLLVFGSDIRVTLAHVGGAVALTLIGTTIGLWEFWYQNRYVPSHAGRAVALNVGLRVVGRQAGFDVIRASVGYEDIGGRSVSVIGSAYTLTGSRVIRCARAPTVSRVASFFNGFLTDPQRIRFMADVREESPSVLAAGKFVGDGKRLDPNVTAGRDFVFLVPEGHYQLLRFRAQLFAIPASVQLSQRTKPEYKMLAGDNELYGFWHVDDDSWLHDLIYGRGRWVIMRYELVDPGDTKARRGKAETTTVTPAFRVTARFPAATWSEAKPGPARTERLFEKQQPSDASEPFADTELALEGVSGRCP
ncbi:MAG TPA: hypothetical protein VIM33_16840 [Gaiellaceae bacterium]